MNEVARNKEILLKAADVAERLSVSPRTVARLNSSGRMPPPVRVGGSVRWRESDISQWIELNCPPRAEFEARKGVA